MPLVCPQCRTENTDQQRVCMNCGATLPGAAAAAGSSAKHHADSDNFDALYAPTLMMGAAGQGAASDHDTGERPASRPRPDPAPPRNNAWGLLLGAAAVVGVVAGASWLLSPSAPTTPASVPAPVPAAVPASASAEPAASVPMPAAPAVPMVPASAVSPVGLRPAGVEAPRRSAQAPKLKAQARPELRRMPSSAPAEVQEVVAAAAPAAIIVSPVAALPEPEPRANAQQICAPRNLFLRGFCETTECAKPEHAGEAHCLALKEMAARPSQR